MKRQGEITIIFWGDEIRNPTDEIRVTWDFRNLLIFDIYVFTSIAVSYGFGARYTLVHSDKIIILSAI